MTQRKKIRARKRVRRVVINGKISTKRSDVDLAEDVWADLVKRGVVA